MITIGYIVWYSNDLKKLLSLDQLFYGKYTAYKQIRILLLYKILQYWIQLSSMIHRGEIVEQAVRASGQNLSKLAKRLGKSRKWLYDSFENPNLSLEYVLEISKAIHFDFTEQIPELRRNYTNNEGDQAMEETTWKDKYIHLLEEHQKLLAKLIEFQARR